MNINVRIAICFFKQRTTVYHRFAMVTG